MDVVGLNRVELVIDQARIHEAVKQFNEAFGLRLPEPIPISGHGALSATDFDGGLEFVAPAPDDTSSSIGRRLAQYGEGQMGPLVFEIRDVETTRSWLESRGFRIRYEYDSRKGNTDEAEMSVHQLHLDPGQWFGFNVTLMQRFEGGAAAAASAGRGAEERNKQAVREFARAMSADDAAGLDALLAPDFVWEFPFVGTVQSALLSGQPVPGPGTRDRATSLAIWHGIVAGSVDQRFQLDVHAVTAERDRVAAECTSSAVNAANGRTYTNRYHSLFVFDGEGRLARMVEYNDSLHTFDVFVAE